MHKLNQILAIERSTKSRVHGDVTRMHHSLQKPALLNGFTKTYRARDEDGDVYPPEKQKVQLQAAEMLKQAGRLIAELVDVTATRDYGNCHAKADLVVDGEVLLSDVPATFLLFLEKQLADLKTFVTKVPPLDAAEDWSLDVGSNLYKTAPIQTSKTKKVQRPIVLYPATDKHPAQTQLISEDVVVGNWVTVKHSGAIPPARKSELLERIERLSSAVKFARETANGVEVTKREVGERLLAYLLKSP